MGAFGFAWRSVAHVRSPNTNNNAEINRRKCAPLREQNWHTQNLRLIRLKSTQVVTQPECQGPSRGAEEPTDGGGAGAQAAGEVRPPGAAKGGSGERRVGRELKHLPQRDEWGRA